MNVLLMSTLVYFIVCLFLFCIYHSAGAYMRLKIFSSTQSQLYDNCMAPLTESKVPQVGRHQLLISDIGYNSNNNPMIFSVTPNLAIPPSFKAKQAPVRMSLTIYNCAVKDNAAQEATPRREL